MKISHARAYTLIELIVVIMIIGILSMLVYAPYSYYQNIAKVRNASERVMQSFSDAKITAASGLSFSWSESNLDIVVILEKGNDMVQVQWIIPGKPIWDTENTKHIRTVALEDGIAILSFSGTFAPVSGIAPISSPNRIGVRFASPTGFVKFYSLDTNPETEIVSLSGGLISLHGATSGPMVVPFNFKTY